jgi:hypothetical protein
MQVRQYNDDDLNTLQKIHAAQNFDYSFPNLSNPLFVSKLILEDCNQLIAMAALARLTCEIYLLADPKYGTPRARYANLQILHQVAKQDLRQRGLEDAHAWLPPRIANRFGQRLASLGWTRDDKWTPYSVRL